MILALDAMGGDNAPQAVVDGAVLALDQLDKDMTIWLFGDEVQIKACLEGKAFSAESWGIKISSASRRRP